MIVGGILGGVVGFVMASYGALTETIQLVTVPMGLILGIAFSIVPIKMVLGKEYGSFRLVLIESDNT